MNRVEEPTGIIVSGYEGSRGLRRAKGPNSKPSWLAACRATSNAFQDDGPGQGDSRVSVSAGTVFDPIDAPS